MRPIVFAFLLSLSFCNPTQTKKAANGNSKIFNAEQLIKDLQFLSSNELKGRLPGTPEMETARAYILNRFRQVGVDSFSTGIQQPFTFKIRSDGSATTGVNIFGVIKGRKRPKDYIVVTAHYDHLGVLSGNIYNGANDNASGTAALFAIASYFKKNPPDHSIIIVALDAEEQGLQGAKKFVADPPVSLTQVLLNVNSDMIGRDVNNNLYAVGTYHYPYLKTYLDKVKSEGSINLLYG
ncbi:MAG TPA: M28 family peptidase, partial [Flavisolibacter sp.]|nr:M28 family peptidase [Flavisolibacter sp.]